MDFYDFCGKFTHGFLVVCMCCVYFIYCSHHKTNRFTPDNPYTRKKKKKMNESIIAKRCSDKLRPVQSLSLIFAKSTHKKITKSKYWKKSNTSRSLSLHFFERFWGFGQVFLQNSKNIYQKLSCCLVSSAKPGLPSLERMQITSSFSFHPSFIFTFSLLFPLHTE